MAHRDSKHKAKAVSSMVYHSSLDGIVLSVVGKNISMHWCTSGSIKRTLPFSVYS